MQKLKQQVSDNLSTTPRLETQSSNTIPDDLLIEIFSLVPAKSIARFRCVSNFWASRLRRPDFTELFQTKSLSRPRLFFTFKANGKLFFYSSPQPQISDDNSTLVATPYFKYFPKYVPSDTCTQVCGLFLLQGWRSKLRVVCNPATGQFLTLPKVPLKKKEKAFLARTYFGYDPIGKQFKVLCIMTSSSPVEINTHRVLTLESGKRSWRPVECNKSYFREDHGIRGSICINGVLYFGARFGLSSVIVCFDVRSEKFDFIDADKDMERGNFAVVLTLFNYKGKLGIHRRNAELYRKDLVLWVLEDAGNHKWSKHIYVLSPCGKKIAKENRFIGMTCTGEIVFFAPVVLSSPNFRVFFYNLETDTFTFTRVNIQGSEKFEHRHTFVDYVEILKFM